MEEETAMNIRNVSGQSGRVRAGTAACALLAGAVVAGLALFAAACSSSSASNTPTPPATAAAATAAPAGAVPAATQTALAAAGLTANGNTLLNLTQLSDIQPKLGAVMFEYSLRYGRIWFAIQAGNWDMARYELLEMREDQEVAETTRPGRASSLKTFESNYLDPLASALDKHDSSTAVSAFTDGINGCNACHKKQTSTDFPDGYKFIKVQVPQTSPNDIVTFTGQ
jgi:hypothetical protein